MQGAGFIRVDYHVTYLGDPESDYPEVDLTQKILAPAEPWGAALISGIAMGHVNFTWETHGSEPPVDDSWEDIAQRVIEVPGGTLVLFDGFGGERDSPNFAFDGPGSYVVRVSHRGRDLEYDWAVDTAQETFHLDVWKSQGGELEGVLKATSERA